MQTTIQTEVERPHIDPASVLRGRDILCFSHDWSGDPLSKTHLMRILARDNRIVSQAELEAAQTGDINPITLLNTGRLVGCD